MSNILLFDLGANEKFALDVLSVREIIKATKYNYLPNSHQFVCGCINVRGLTVPVLDLPQMLFSHSVPSESSMVILLDCPEGPYGLKVANVHSIAKINLESVKKDTLSRGYTDGVFEHEGALVQILNIARVIARISVRDLAA